MGMLMWGLTLRHGWGVQKDENRGFVWIRKAAEAAVGNLEAAVDGVNAGAVQVSADSMFAILTNSD
jgi:TPR repeat protein